MLPMLIIDFTDWFYVERQNIDSMPLEGHSYLRMTMSAQTASPTHKVMIAGAPGKPVEVSFSGAPTFSWRDASLGQPSFQTGIAAFGVRQYYWYLVEVIDGVATALVDSTYIQAGTPAVFD